jgi:hypothetical protein
MEASASHSVRTASTVEALASAESAVTANTGEAAVPRMPWPVVDAVVHVIVVMSFMTLPVSKVPPISMTPVARVRSIAMVPATMVPIAVPVAEVIKIVVKAEEKKWREAHVKR